MGLKEIVAKGIVKAKEIIEKIKAKLFPALENEELMADAITCEDVLAKEICAKLKDAAEKLKQKAKVIDQLVREAIAKKVTEAKEIIKRVRQKLIDMAKDFKCEDVLSTKACDKLREIAETLKIKAAEVTKMLKEIVAKGIVKAKEIIEKIKAKLFPALENE